MSEDAPTKAGHELQPSELTGNIKVTRQDWLDAAMDILVSDGVERVKVLTIGERLGVSRSSFYWYFKSRRHLLDTLLDRWQQTNTAAIVRQTKVPAETIAEATLNVFRCFVDSELFDSRLDFAIRDWARRSPGVKEKIDASDDLRIDALKAMFCRFDYAETDALIRARVLYYMQIGYYAAELGESMETRLNWVSHYVYAFTGQQASSRELEAFSDYVFSIIERDRQ